MKSVRNIYKSIVWAIIVFILSSISGNQLNKFPKIKIPHLDKLVHFGMYFILALLLLSGLMQFQKAFFKKYFKIIVFISVITYGGIIELLQQSVFEKRSMDIYDFIANSIGVITAIILYPIIRRTKYLF